MRWGARQERRHLAADARGGDDSIADLDMMAVDQSERIQEMVGDG